MEREKKILSWPLIILLILAPFIFRTIFGLLTGGDIERVRTKIEKHLYEKYGEEFVVDQIGTRSSMGEKFYQARIYPESIIGTNKEWDDYYYASASVNKYPLGRLGGVGDSYPLVNLKLGIEDYLMPETKEIFGERILMKIEAHYKKREPGNVTFWGYKVKSFEKARELIAEDPGNRMIELDLQVYIFDRIENEAEKEMRRKQIFDYIQYLKEESLYDYLEMGVIFIDERVLAPSYDDFSLEIYVSDKVREVVEGEAVYMPPMELRKKMSRVLQQEVDQMSEEELLESMREKRKDELENFIKYDMQYVSLVYSFGILEERYSSSITEEERKEKYNRYNSIEKIKLEQPYNFIYKY